MIVAYAQMEKNLSLAGRKNNNYIIQEEDHKGSPP